MAIAIQIAVMERIAAAKSDPDVSVDCAPPRMCREWREGWP
jgi:hypothetical protein